MCDKSRTFIINIDSTHKHGETPTVCCCSSSAKSGGFLAFFGLILFWLSSLSRVIQMQFYSSLNENLSGFMYCGCKQPLYTLHSHSSASVPDLPFGVCAGVRRPFLCCDSNFPMMQSQLQFLVSFSSHKCSSKLNSLSNFLFTIFAICKTGSAIVNGPRLV